MKQLYLIPTFHHDIAYLRPESWYTETATRIFDRAVAIMKENPEYTCTVEQAPYGVRGIRFSGGQKTEEA